MIYPIRHDGDARVAWLGWRPHDTFLKVHHVMPGREVKIRRIVEADRLIREQTTLECYRTPAYRWMMGAGRCTVIIAN